MPISSPNRILPSTEEHRHNFQREFGDAIRTDSIDMQIKNGTNSGVEDHTCAPSRRTILGLGAVLAASSTGRAEAFPVTQASRPYVKALITGQSLGAMWATTPATAEFIAAFARFGDSRPVSVLNVAHNGSAISMRCAASARSCWWNEITVQPGELLMAAVAAIRAAAQKPTAIIHIQGNTEAKYYPIASPTDAIALESLFVTNTALVLAHLRVAIDPRDPLSVPVFLQALGPLNGEMEPAAYPGYAVVRRAQRRLVDSPRLNIRWGYVPNRGMESHDGTHPTRAEFGRIAYDTAERMRDRI